METQKTPNSQNNLEKEAGSITLSDYKLCYKAILIKIVWFWHKNRHIYQWQRIESPEMNLHKYSQVIYDIKAKNIQWGKRQSFQ